VNATETARLVQLYEAGLPQKDIANGLAGARVPCGTVCAGWGEREQGKISFLERRRLSQHTGYWCGGRNVSVCGECSTAVMCMPAWAMGAPIGLRVTSVGTLHTTSPATGRASFGDRKSL
jgi:hypothetical protein